MSTKQKVKAVSISALIALCNCIFDYNRRGKPEYFAKVFQSIIHVIKASADDAEMLRVDLAAAQRSISSLNTTVSQLKVCNGSSSADF
jgi:hypothetical protein